MNVGPEVLESLQEQPTKKADEESRDRELWRVQMDPSYHAPPYTAHPMEEDEGVEGVKFMVSLTGRTNLYIRRCTERKLMEGISLWSGFAVRRRRGGAQEFPVQFIIQRDPRPIWAQTQGGNLLVVSYGMLTEMRRLVDLGLRAREKRSGDCAKERPMQATSHEGMSK